MKILFKKIAVCGFILSTSVNVYGHKEDLLNTDPGSSLRTAMGERARQVYNDLQRAEHEENPCKPIGYCLFDLHKRTPKPVLSEEQKRKNKEAQIAKDKIELKLAKNTLKKISDEITDVKKTLKTDAAKAVLAEMLGKSKVEISDSAKVDCVYELFRDAFSDATTVLLNHVKAGILVGSSDEQSDLEKLCQCLKGMGYYLEPCLEENAFYSALRRKYSECYDAVPPHDVITRSKILQKVLEVSDEAFSAADDGDDLAVDSSLVEVAENYIAAVRLWFVKKTHPTVMTYVFKDQKTFERFERFSVKAPDLFRYCKSNTQATIEAKLWKNGWSYWEQKGYQTIWVNYEGDTSLRIKDDGEFTVGFLSENPYFRDGTLDRYYLGDRSSELIKCALVSDYAFFNPASLKDYITGFWASYTKYLQVSDGKKIMDFDHDKVK